MPKKQHHKRPLNTTLTLNCRCFLPNTCNLTTLDLLIPSARAGRSQAYQRTIACYARAVSAALLGRGRLQKVVRQDNNLLQD